MHFPFALPSLCIQVLCRQKHEPKLQMLSPRESAVQLLPQPTNNPISCVPSPGIMIYFLVCRSFRGYPILQMKTTILQDSTRDSPHFRILYSQAGQYMYANQMQLHSKGPIPVTTARRHIPHIIWGKVAILELSPNISVPGTALSPSLGAIQLLFTKASLSLWTLFRLQLCYAAFPENM